MTGFFFGRWPSPTLLAADIGTDSSVGVEAPNRSFARRSRASSTRCCNARRRSRSSGVGGRISSFSSSGSAMAVRLSDLQGIGYLNLVSADRRKLVNWHTVTACRQVCRPISQHDRRRAQQQASRPAGRRGLRVPPDQADTPAAAHAAMIPRRPPDMQSSQHGRRRSGQQANRQNPPSHTVTACRFFCLTVRCDNYCQLTHTNSRLSCVPVDTQTLSEGV